MLKKLSMLLTEAVAGTKGRWITAAVWVVIAGVLSSTFPDVNKVIDNSAANLPAGEMSVQAEKIAKEQFPNFAGTPLLVVWYRNGGLNDQDLQSISNMYKYLNKNPLTQQNYIPPFAKMPPQGLKGLVSKDGTSVIAPIFMKKTASTDSLSADIETLQKQLIKNDPKNIFSSHLNKPGLHVRFTGPVGIATDATKLFSKADITLMISTVLLVLILLIILYRSPLLAIVPLIGVGFAYGVTSPLLGFLAKKGLITVDAQAASIMTVLLFGAGTDYCLFLVAKYREYLLEETNKLKALKRAVQHSGGAILVSALTVVVSLLTLSLAHFGSYQRFAVPFSLVILIMGLVAVTLLPALLGILGRASFFPFIPRTDEMLRKLEMKKGKKMKKRHAHGRFSLALGNLVTRKPWPVIVASVVILGVLASFSSRVQYTQNLIDSFPKDMPSREGFDLMAAHFSPGDLAPVQVIINTEGKTVRLAQKLSALPYVAGVSDTAAGAKNSDYFSLNLNLKENPYDTKTVNLIPKIANQVSAALNDAGVKPNSHFWIGGETSTLYDTQKTTDRDYRVIVPTVIAIISVLLLFYLRSIVAMLYLILTVLLSYFSALGTGWLIIHWGLGIPAISGLIPLYAFVFLVALGEDYNIFMISSIWKNRKTQSHKEAIARGVSETSSVITSAGLILAGTFAVLATLPIQVLLQFGIVTAVGVLLDTFVVRPLLVPAITAVLGRYAFWPGKLWRQEDRKTVHINDKSV